MLNKTKGQGIALTSTAVLALLCVSAVDVAAQQRVVEEIIVTARKREESLFDVPLSITAVTAADIENKGVQDLRDVINLTPGLSMSEFGAGTLNFPVIRGLTNLTAGSFAENNVSVFYNGAYLVNSNIIDATFLDIERIEVVKGPVSALYGRNAYSGVINYVTKRPSEKFEGNAKFTAGTYDRYGVQGSVSGPVVDGKVGVRIAGRLDNFGGTWEDKVSGIDFGGYKKRAVQGALEFTPSESVNVLTNLYYSDDLFDQPARALTDGNCGAPAGAFQPVICGKTPDFDKNTESRIKSANPGFKLYGNDRDLLLATGDISIDVGSFTLRSITSYMDSTQAQNRDTDGTGIGRPYPLVGVPAGTVNLSTYTFLKNKDDAVTEELRLSSDQEQKIKWSLGGFYSDFHRDADVSLAIDSAPVPAGRTALILFPIGTSTGGVPALIQKSKLTDEEYSGFGHLEFDVTEHLTVSAEARYTDQTKFQNQRTTFFTTPFVDPDGANGIKASWSFWSFRFTTEYAVGDGSKLYASAAKGNKAGGFNAGTASLADLQYNPETNWTYEAGYKAVLNDGQLTLNTAVFYADLSSLQLNGFTANGLSAVIRNGGQGKTYGLEADMAANVAEGISVSAGLAYSNPTFKSGAAINSSADVGQCRNIPACANRVQTDALGRAFLNLAGLSLPRQSDWQTTLGFDVVQPLTDSWDWTVRGNYRYESKQYATTPQANVGYAGSKHIANLRTGVESDRYKITLYVENLLNDATPFNFGSNANPSNFTNPQFVVYGDKRTFGIEVGAKF